MTFTKKIFLPLAAIVVLVVPASAMAAPHPKAKVQLSSAAYAVAENQGPATITVVRPRNGHSAVRLAQSVSVDYSTIDGTAKAGVDYVATSGTLTFPACSSGSPAASDPCVTQTFQVPVINNYVADGTRVLTVKLSNARSSTGRAILGYPSQAALAIADDDPATVGSGSTFQFVIPVDYVSESASPATAYVVRSGDLSQGAAISYSTADGVAKDGTDYTSTHGTLNFPGQATNPVTSVIQPVQVTLLANPASDPQLSDFSVNLSVPAGSSSQVAAPGSEQIWIVNSDGQATVVWAAPSYNTSEAQGTVRLLAIGAGQITGNDEVDADYATADGTAKAGVNYTAQNDTFQFFAGDLAETADVAILDDGVTGDTSFTTGLSNPSAGAQIGNPSTTTVNIADSGNRSGVVSTGTTGGDTSSTTSTTGQDQGSQIVLGARQSACGLTIKAVKKQRLVKQKGLKLKLRSTQRCSLAIKATVQKAKSKKGARSAKALRFKGKNASLTLQPGKAKTVTVKFTKKTLKAISKALRARNKLVATVVVSERISASKVKAHTLKITIRR